MRWLKNIIRYIAQSVPTITLTVWMLGADFFFFCTFVPLKLHSASDFDYDHDTNSSNKNCCLSKCSSTEIKTKQTSHSTITILYERKLAVLLPGILGSLLNYNKYENLLNCEHRIVVVCMRLFRLYEISKQLTGVHELARRWKTTNQQRGTGKPVLRKIHSEIKSWQFMEIISNFLIKFRRLSRSEARFKIRN